MKLDIKALQDEGSSYQTEFLKLKAGLKEELHENIKTFEKTLLEEISLDISKDFMKKKLELIQNQLKLLENDTAFLKKHIRHQACEFKVSPICSSSSILLKYQELFKAKSKNETDMIINERTTSTIQTCTTSTQKGTCWTASPGTWWTRKGVRSAWRRST